MVAFQSPGFLLHMILISKISESTVALSFEGCVNQKGCSTLCAAWVLRKCSSAIWNKHVLYPAPYWTCWLMNVKWQMQCINNLSSWIMVACMFPSSVCCFSVCAAKLWCKFSLLCKISFALKLRSKFHSLQLAWFSVKLKKFSLLKAS